MQFLVLIEDIIKYLPFLSPSRPIHSFFSQQYTDSKFSVTVNRWHTFRLHLKKDTIQY